MIVDVDIKPCHNCGKQTIVPTVSPCRESDKLTGMWLSQMDEDFGEEKIGVLCADCAFKLCDEGKVSLGFSGGRLGNLENWDAWINGSKLR